MNEINFKKIRNIVVIIYIVAAALFLFAAWDVVSTMTLFGVRLTIPFIVCIVLAGLLLLWYMVHLERCRDKGKKSWGLNFINVVYRYRFLITQLVTRDFKIKYKRSVLGVFWSFLNPLLMMVVQYVVFSYLLNMRGDVEHYAIYLLCGIVMWNGFSDCTNQSMRSITGNASLITKVYVPKYIYPVTKVFSAFVNVLLSMIPLLVVAIVYGLFATPHLYLTKAILLLPVGLFFLMVFCMGVGFLLSSLMVFFHDIEFLWSVITMAWMYATPIIYSLSMFRDSAPWLVSLMQINPLYHYIDFIRTIILGGTSPVIMEYVICAAFSLVTFGVGLLVFKKTQDKFILYI